jgi:hypothetical protein
VLEAPSRGQRIPVRRESVVAFIGSAPRGPTGIPVAIRTVDEYRRRFGVPGHRGRVQDLLAQFFDNGGTNAICVRVTGSERRHRISMPGVAGDLVLHAINPGPHECLRASVDYDAIPDAEGHRFNLVIHRLMSRDRPIVEEQEIYRAVSVDPADPDFIMHALVDSQLVQVVAPVPLARPGVTRCPGVEVGGSYEYADDDWRDVQALNDYDLIGCNTEGTGLSALDRVPVIDMLCLVPDRDDIGPVALFAAEQYCRERQALLFCDPPTEWETVGEVVRDRLASAYSSPNVVTYYPRPVTRPGSGLNRSPSALGAFMGCLAAEDARNGFWSQRDNFDIRCRVNLATMLDEHERAALRRFGVNALRECFGGYAQSSGLVTMERSSGLDAGWSDLRRRRLCLFVTGSIARATRWASFADDVELAWTDLRAQVEAFMSALFDAGALPGASAKQAWYVTRDRELGGAPGTTDFIVGLALEEHQFMAFRFAHDRLECHVQPVAWQPGIALAS